MGRSSASLSRLWGAATAAVLTVLACATFYAMLAERPAGTPNDDHYFHLDIIQNDPPWPPPVPHPLYHWVVQAALRLAPEKGPGGLAGCAAAVLALAVGLRGWLTQRELSATLSGPAAAVACLLLAVAMALPNWWRFPAPSLRSVELGFDPGHWLWRLPSVYLGQLNPNVWHNPTAVFAGPFALLVFLVGMHNLDKPGIVTALCVGVASSLCALAKPNYLLAFLPCLGAAMAFEEGRALRQDAADLARFAARVAAAFGPPAAVFLWQMNQVGDQFFLEPFKVWREYSANVPASALLGMAFPAAVAACYPREVLADRRTALAWCVLAVAVAQFALLAEAKRYASANFNWGMIAADYVLFVESCRLLAGQHGRVRIGLCVGVLMLHAAAGALFLARAVSVPQHALFF